MLLYPTTSQDLNEAMSVQGHRICVATVNLSKEWETIEARLLALVRSAYDPLGGSRIGSRTIRSMIWKISNATPCEDLIPNCAHSSQETRAVM